jgi:hypothetical protein
MNCTLQPTIWRAAMLPGRIAGAMTKPEPGRILAQLPPAMVVGVSTEAWNVRKMQETILAT